MTEQHLAEWQAKSWFRFGTFSQPEVVKIFYILILAKVATCIIWRRSIRVHILIGQLFVKLILWACQRLALKLFCKMTLGQHLYLHDFGRRSDYVRISWKNLTSNYYCSRINRRTPYLLSMYKSSNLLNIGFKNYHCAYRFMQIHTAIKVEMDTTIPKFEGDWFRENAWQRFWCIWCTCTRSWVWLDLRQSGKTDS